MDDLVLLDCKKINVSVIRVNLLQFRPGNTGINGQSGLPGLPGAKVSFVYQRL